MSLSLGWSAASTASARSPGSSISKSPKSAGPRPSPAMAAPPRRTPFYHTLTRPRLGARFRPCRRPSGCSTSQPSSSVRPSRSPGARSRSSSPRTTAARARRPSASSSGTRRSSSSSASRSSTWPATRTARAGYLIDKDEFYLPGPQAAARGPGPPLPGRLGGARLGGLPLLPRPRPRHEQALLRGPGPGRRGGGGAGHPEPVRGRRAASGGAGRPAGGALPRGGHQEAGPPALRRGRAAAPAPSATSIPTASSSAAAPGSSPAGATCARTLRTFHLGPHRGLPRQPGGAAHPGLHAAHRPARWPRWRRGRPGSSPSTPPLRCRVRLEPPASPEVRASFGPRARFTEEDGATVVELGATNARGAGAPRPLAGRPGRAPRPQAAPRPGPRDPGRPGPEARVSAARPPQAGRPGRPQPGQAGRKAARTAAGARRGGPRPRRRAAQGDPRDRLRRVLFLVPYAVQHPGILVKDLARRCGVTELELLEDLDFLMGVGSPPFAPDDFLDLYVEGDRVHVALHQSFSRPPRFTESEAAALAAAVRALGGEGRERALKALRDAVPRDRRASYDELSGRIYAGAPPARDSVLGRLQRSIAERRVVRLAYHSASSDSEAERQVHPYTLAQRLGHWYLYGHDVSPRPAARLPPRPDPRVRRERRAVRAAGRRRAGPGPPLLRAHRRGRSGSGSTRWRPPGRWPGRAASELVKRTRRRRRGGGAEGGLGGLGHPLRPLLRGRGRGGRTCHGPAPLRRGGPADAGPLHLTPSRAATLGLWRSGDRPACRAPRNQALSDPAESARLAHWDRATEVSLGRGPHRR